VDVKKVVAREWLYLLVGLFVGTTLFLFLSFVTGESFTDSFVFIFGTLLDPTEPDWFVAFGFVMGPYFVFQLVRSIRWAIRTTRS